MDAKQHAWLARTLVDACGGIDACAARCRVARSRLSDYGNPNQPDAYMPADVIDCLETYCGQPIYSRALFENSPGAVEARQLADEACETTEAAAELQRIVRLKPVLTRGEQELALVDLDLIEGHTRVLRDLVTRGRP